MDEEDNSNDHRNVPTGGQGAVVLADFANYIDAHIALGQLQEAGIRCWLKDEHSITINPFLANALGGIKLIVPARDARQAREVLGY